MTTLENLYYGNIAPHEYEVVRGSEYDITAKLVIRHEQESPRAGIVGYTDGAAERHTPKNQRQPYRAYEPRRARRVSSGFLFGCQIDG